MIIRAGITPLKSVVSIHLCIEFGLTALQIMLSKTILFDIVVQFPLSSYIVFNVDVPAPRI